MFAQGIHFTEKTCPKRILQPAAGLTTSTAFHSLQQLQIDYGALDYAFLSPIFNSISKQGYDAAFNLDDLAAHVKQSSTPLVALGGECLHVHHLLSSQQQHNMIILSPSS